MGQCDRATAIRLPSAPYLQERVAAMTVPLDAASDRIREHLHQSRGQEAIAKEVEQLRALAKVELLTPL